MKRPLKILAWTAGAILALFLIAVIVLPLVVDPNDFRDEIAGAVESRTGRELVIEGDLELSVFPWLGVDVGRARLANAPFAGDAPMLAIEGASVGVRLLPLLSGRLEVRRVTLDGLRLSLYRGPEGTNWDSFTAGEAPGGADAVPADEEAAFGTGEIGGVRLRDAQVSYRDEVDGVSLEASLGSLDSGRIRLAGETATIEDLGLESASLDFEDAARGRLSGSIASLAAESLSARDGNARIAGLTLRKAGLETGGELGDWTVKIDNMETASVVTGPGAPEIGESTVAGLQLSQGGQGGFELAAARLETGGFTADAASPRMAGLELRDGRYAYDIEGQGRLAGTIPELTLGPLQPGSSTPLKGRIEGSWGEPAVSFDARIDGKAGLEGSAITVAELALVLGLRGESIPTGSQEGRLAVGRLVVDTEAQTLDLQGLEAQLAGLSLSAAATGSQVLDDPRLSGSLRTNTFSPRKLMGTLGLEPPETTDPAVLERASLEGDFSYTGERITLPSLAATLDDTRLSGRLSYAPGDPAVIRSSLQVDGIDLDRYLAPAGEDGTADDAGDAEPATEIPTEALRGLDVEADLSMGWVRIAGIRMSEVRARALVKDGVLRVDPLAASLYEGRVDGRLAVDGSGQVPVVSFEQRLESVKLGPLVTDLAEVSRIQGTANLSLNASGSGTTSAELLQALAGQMSFDIQDGVLTGINLVHSLRMASALLKGNAAPEKTESDTRFQTFGGSARFRDGRMVNDDLKITASALQVTGQGSVGLVGHDVDYRLRATVPRGEAATEAGLGDLAGSTIPVRITGSLDSLTVRPDLGGVIRNQAESLLRKKLGLDKEEAAPEETGATGEEAQQAVPEEEPPAEQEPRNVEDALKEEARKKLKDLFGG